MKQRGFTLVEVMVAVFVLAISLGAIITGMSRYADTAGYLKRKTVALWVAHNRLAELQMQGVAPEVGNSDGDAEMGNTTWTWNATVQETPDPNLRRIDIRVSPQGRGEQPVLASLSSFVVAQSTATTQ